MYNEHYSRVDFSACYWSIECNEAVGIQSGDVDDKDITVSSKRHDFNVLDAWCPATVNRKQYFQVNLGFKTKITKVSTQGRLGNLDRHVKSYRLYYSMDGHDWKVYQTEGVDKVGINRRRGLAHYEGELIRAFNLKGYLEDGKDGGATVFVKFIHHIDFFTNN